MFVGFSVALIALTSFQENTICLASQDRNVSMSNRTMFSRFVLTAITFLMLANWTFSNIWKRLRSFISLVCLVLRMLGVVLPRWIIEGILRRHVLKRGWRRDRKGRHCDYDGRFCWHGRLCQVHYLPENIEKALKAAEIRAILPDGGTEA